MSWPLLSITAFMGGARRAQGFGRVVTWEALAGRLATHPEPPPLPWACSEDCCAVPWRRPGTCPRCRAQLVPDKRSLPAWSPWTYDGARRSHAGARWTCALVIDYDGAAPLDTYRGPWETWAHVGHTTWSHRDEARAHARVVLPLARPCDAATWPRLWAWATAHDARQDRTVGDAGRLYYAPWHTGRTVAAWHHEAPLLDLAGLDLPEAAEPVRPVHRSELRPPGGAPPGGRARLLRTDPAAREQLGLQLGGRSTSGKVKGVPCPRCARPSVWWWISEGAAAGAWMGAGCEHRRSCGWTGWLDQVEKAVAIG